jgi:hypothetical protein
MELSTRTRRALSTVLAVFLAVESVSAVAAAAATRTVTQELPDAPPVAVLAVKASVPAGPVADPVVIVAEPVVIVADSPADDVRPSQPLVTEPAVTVPVRVAVPDRPAKAAKADASPSRAKQASSNGSSKTSGSRSNAKPARKPASFSGRNHVWIPALNISRSVRWFPCDRTRAPDHYMYRWGCAGRNNIYLMGHASSVMSPLHNAYVSGRLRVGMKAYYAGANGKVHVYVVKWWKKTRPTTDAA